MAIKEFEIGPQSYFEEDYFSGDYTESNVSRSFLECDIDNIKGGRVVTGEYYEDNYIDGTYFHNNTMGFQMVVEAMVVQEAVINATNYFQDSYYESGYFQDSGSRFSIVIRTGETVEAQGSLTAEVSQTATAAKILQGAAQFTAEFQQSATISHIEGADLFALSEAAMQALAARSRDYAASLDDVFDVATDYVRFRTGSATADAEFAQSVDGARSRDFDTLVEAAVSVEASADRIRDAEISIDSLFTPSINAGLSLQDSVEMFSSFDVLARNITYRARDTFPRPLIPSNTPNVLFNAIPGQFGTRAFFSEDWIDGNDRNRRIVYSSTSAQSISPNNTDEWAISFWIQDRDGSSNSNVLLIYDASQPIDGNTFILRIYEIFNTLRVQFKDVNGNFKAVTTNVNLDDPWKFFTLLYKPGQGFKIYLDGVKVGELLENFTLRIPSTANYRFNIGSPPYAISTTLQSFFDLDELRVVKGPNAFSNNGFDFSQDTVTVQTQPYVSNDTDTRLLLHFNEDLVDDVKGFVSYSADITTTAALTGSITGVTRADAALNSESNVVVSASKTHSASAALDASATVTANVNYIAENTVTLDGAMTFNANIDSITFGDVLCEVIATLAVEAIANKGVVAALTAQSAVAANVDVLPGIEANLTAAATISADVTRLPGAIAQLSSTSTVTAEANFEYLRLNNGAAIITTNINQTILSGALNMWLRLSRNLAAGEEIYLWRTAKSLTYENSPFPDTLNVNDGVSYIAIGKWGPGGSLNKYYFRSLRYVNVQPEYGGPGWVWQFNNSTINADIDFTEWHNVTLPFFGGEAGMGTSIDGGAYQVFISGDSSNLNSGSVYSNVNAGVWDANKSDLSVEIHKLWIKSRESGGFVAPNFYAIPWEQKYGVNGAVDGIVPDIYHNWEDGLTETGNNIEPQWNYRVAKGVVVTGFTLDVPSALSVQATLNADIDVIVSVLTAAQSEFTVVADNSRTRNPGTTTIEAVATQETVGVKIALGNAAFTSTVNSTITAVKTVRAEDTLETITTVSASLNRVRFADAALSTASTLAVDVEVTRTTSADFAVEFTQPNVNYDRFRDNDIATDSIATALTAAAKIGDFLVTLESRFEQNTDARKTTDTPITLSAEVSQTTDAIKSVIGVAALAAEHTVTANVDKIRAVTANFEAATTSTVAAVKITDVVSDNDITADTDITFTRVRFGEVSLNSNATFSCDGDKIRLLAADIESRFECVASAFKVQRAEATLEVSGFVLTAGNVIHLDPFRTLLVPQETRYIKVLEERRALIVKEETRVLTV